MYQNSRDAIDYHSLDANTQARDLITHLKQAWGWQMAVGLTREEFEELYPISNPFHNLCRQGGRPVYPIGRSAVVQELRQRGFAASENVVTHLIRQGVCAPHRIAAGYIFGPGEIDAMANHMEQAHQFYGAATLCHFCGASYAAYLRSLYQACILAGEEFGERKFDNSEIARPLFELTISPAGISRQLDGYRSARVEFRFTLTEEARQFLESAQ